MTIAEREASQDARRAGATGRGRDAHLDPVEAVRLIRRHWSLFRNVALAVVILTVGVLYALPTSYSTSAVVMLEPRRNTVTDQTAVLSDLPTDPASIQDQIQLLTSRDLAEQVVEKLGLDRDPEFAGDPGAPSLNPLNWLRPPAPQASREDAVVTAFLKHLSVSSVGLSTTIAVTASSRDPQKAALIADTVVAAYLDTEAAIRFDVTQRTTTWLLQRIRELGQQVQIAEANIQRYKAENNLTDTANGGSIVDQQLAAINAQLVSARENLAAKEAENDRVVAMMQAGHGADVTQIVASPLIIQLREQQADIIRQEGELTARYGDKYPKMIAAENQRRDLDAKIAEEVARIAGSVQSDVAVARAQVRSLEDSLQRAEREAAGQNMARVKLQSLEANAVSTRSMYESFVGRLRETQGQDGLAMLDARVISHAPVPLAPSWPPRLPIALASIPAGLLLGFLAVLLAERLGGVAAPDLRAVPHPRQDPLRGVPVLAEVAGAARAADLVIEQPYGAAAQALRGLAGRLARARGRARVVAVTSLDPRDGQTAVALGLARSAAQAGARVILLDANLRAPAAARCAGLAAASAGMVEVVAGAAPLGRSLQRDPRSGVLILSGPPRPAPRDLWSSAAVARFAAYLRQNADLVVIDAAALAPASELPQIARLADALIVVAAWDGGPRPGLGAALDHLKGATRAPAGLVLTR